MTRELPRTNFNNSELQRFLADRTLLDANEPGPSFAERLALWLSFTDAIKLLSANTTGSPVIALTTDHTIVDDFELLQQGLIASIAKSFLPDQTGARIKLPNFENGVTTELVAAYEPYRRFYLVHQRDMEQRIRAFRVQARSALAATSSALQRLATLDGTLDDILSERETRLLGMLPALLEQRFEELCNAHRRSTLDHSPNAEGMALFLRELQEALLAELNLRLLPIRGLINAINNRISTQQ